MKPTCGYCHVTNTYRPPTPPISLFSPRSFFSISHHNQIMMNVSTSPSITPALISCRHMPHCSMNTCQKMLGMFLWVCHLMLARVISRSGLGRWVVQGRGGVVVIVLLNIRSREHSSPLSSLYPAYHHHYYYHHYYFYHYLQVGQSKEHFSKGLHDEFNKRWEEVVTSVTGYNSYDELRDACSIFKKRG